MRKKKRGVGVGVEGNEVKGKCVIKNLSAINIYVNSINTRHVLCIKMFSS